MWPLALLFALGVGAAMVRKTNPAVHRQSTLTKGRRYLLRVLNLVPDQPIGAPEVEVALQAGMSDPSGAKWNDAQPDPGNVAWTVIFDWVGETGEFFVWDSPYILADIGSTLMVTGVPTPQAHTAGEPL